MRFKIVNSNVKTWFLCDHTELKLRAFYILCCYMVFYFSSVLPINKIKMKTIVCLLHHRTVSRIVVIKKKNKKYIGIYVALYPDAQSALQHFVGDFARLLI